jgi:hypothetical protein
MISFKLVLTTPKRQPIKKLIEDWESVGLYVEVDRGGFEPPTS